MLDGSVPIAISDSLLVSVIGIFVVFMELILLAILIVIISKAIRRLTEKEDKASTIAVIGGADGPTAVFVTSKANAAATPAPAPAPVAAPAYVAAPPLVLADVDAPTAATAMAVISHKTGIALNHLAFHSIKGVVALEGISEREAAVLMALTAHQTGKPLEKLCFKSIRYAGDATAAPAPAKKVPAKKPAAKKTTDE